MPIQLAIYPFLKLRNILDELIDLEIMSFKGLSTRNVYNRKTDTCTFHSPKCFPTRLSKLNKRLGE